MIKLSSLRIFAYGTLVAIIILIGSFLLLNTPECPSDWYQRGITNCATGANIGLGLGIVMAALVWLITIVASIIGFVRSIFTKKK
jgi:Trk-type K+ transport system membrane component